MFSQAFQEYDRTCEKDRSVAATPNARDASRAAESAEIVVNAVCCAELSTIVCAEVCHGVGLGAKNRRTWKEQQAAKGDAQIDFSTNDRKSRECFIRISAPSVSGDSDVGEI